MENNSILPLYYRYFVMHAIGLDYKYFDEDHHCIEIIYGKTTICTLNIDLSKDKPIFDYW